MTNKLFIILLILIPVCSYAQIGEPALVTMLDIQVEETSGLMFHNNELWTHNDSGGESKLFSIDTTNGSVIRTVEVLNAQNNDWEDICKDENYVYIGDFGNNSGARDDLRIYKISLSDLEEQETTSINSEIINFAYDPEIYSGIFKNRNNTNFDCEAMIAYGDSLYLFSKNWIDKKSYLYALPKEPGSYIAHLKDTLNTNGLICGADYCDESNEIALIGYQYGIPAPSIIVLLSDFVGDDFYSGTIIRKELSLDGCQTEGIVFNNKNKIWISNEDFLSYDQSLFSIDITPQGVEGIDNSLFCQIYPNPTTERLIITFPCEKNKCKLIVKIFDDSGKTVFYKKAYVSENQNTKEIDTSVLKPGRYTLQVLDKKLYFQTGFIKL